MEVVIPRLSLSDLAASGQCFRMKAVAPGQYRVIAHGRVLRVADLGGGRFDFDCIKSDFDAVWFDYFDLSLDYAKIASLVPKDDLFLTRAAACGAGLRILRQEPWEMLVSFLISQRRSIPAIETSVEALCRAFGRPLEDDLYAFPTPEALAVETEESLRPCSMGYRAPYVLTAARAVADGSLDLDALCRLSDGELLERLLSLRGVGPKVASCVMLFGYHRLNACPVDVWIQRVVDEEYHGEPPFAKYAPFAGVMQQYLFFYRRSRAG